MLETTFRRLRVLGLAAALLFAAGCGKGGVPTGDQTSTTTTTAMTTVTTTMMTSTTTSVTSSSKTFTSSYVVSASFGGHTHEITLPSSVITSPPSGGISMTTTSNAGHTHTVVITDSQLEQANGGATVTVTTSTWVDHSHTFAIAKWF